MDIIKVTSLYFMYTDVAFLSGKLKVKLKLRF
jgi:hypothetical protein